MTFKKIALAAAIAAVPAIGYSVENLTVENLDESALSDVTGQDGILVQIQPGAAGINTNLIVHDKDGLGAIPSSPGYSYAGAIVISNFQMMVGNASPVTLAIDAGDNQLTGGPGSAPVLQIAVTLPAAITIATGDISVANSGRDEGNFLATNQSATILSSMTIVLGSTTMNIQLGNEAQAGYAAATDMIKISSSVTNGVNISNFRLNDASVGGGSIGAGTVAIADNGGTNLTLKVDANVTSSGLELSLAQVGDAVTGLSMNLTNVYLGTTSLGYIGDLSVVGLNVNGTKVIISGK